LSRSAFCVLGVFFKESFINLALHIDIHAHPRFIVDEFNKPSQFCRVLNLVLGFPEDNTQHPFALAEGFQDVAVVDFKLIAIFGKQALPIEPHWDV